MTRRVAAIVVLLALLEVGWAVPSQAHGAEGTLDITRVTEVRPFELEVEARAWYRDCDGAARAVVRARLERADDPLPPPSAPLVRTGGNRYAGSVHLPGPSRWTLQLESTTPVASREVKVDVDGTAAKASLVPPAREPDCPTSHRRTILMAVGAAILLAGAAVELRSRRRHRRRREEST